MQRAGDLNLRYVSIKCSLILTFDFCAELQRPGRFCMKGGGKLCHLTVIATNYNLEGLRSQLQRPPKSLSPAVSGQVLMIEQKIHERKPYLAAYRWAQTFWGAL